MSFRQHEHFQESGVEWIGVIPLDWSVKRLSMVFGAIGSGTTPPDNSNGYYGGEVNWVTTGELREQAIRKTAKKLSAAALLELSALRLYPAGTLLIAMYGATIGRLGWLEEPACTNQACCAFAEPRSVSTRYVYYALQAALQALLLLSSGGGQPNINQEKLRAFRIPVPSLEEQESIAAFLDGETAKIDALVEEQRRLIELLKEKRQAVVSHAVTKGLDPSAPMKDSGVEWLGEVPAHWDVARLQDQAAFFQGKAHEPYVDDAGEHICVTARFVSTDGAAIKTCTTNLSPAQAGDILMVMSDLPNGRALARAYLVEDNRSYAVNQRVCCVRFSRGSSAYFAYQLNRSKQLLQFNDGVEQTHLTNGAFTKLRLAVPPVEEQHAIARYLKKVIGNLEDLAVAADHATNLLIERRAALISAAVTGKIDVRHVDAGRRAA